MSDEIRCSEVEVIFSALLDVGSIWLAGIPALALVVFVFHAPVEWVYLAIMSESLVKGIIGFQRYFSRRWIRNITSGAEITPPVVLQP